MFIIAKPAVRWIKGGPKQITRDIEDIKDITGDILGNTPARTIYSREVKKKIKRGLEDTIDNWKK